MSEYLNLACQIIYGIPAPEPTCRECGEILYEAEEASGYCSRHQVEVIA